MRKAKLKALIHEMIEQECKMMSDSEIWNFTHWNRADIKEMKPKIEHLETTINNFWQLPIFKEYRGQ